MVARSWRCAGAAAALLLGAASAACVGGVDEKAGGAPADAGADPADGGGGGGDDVDCPLARELGSYGALYQPFAVDAPQDSPPPGDPGARVRYVQGSIGDPLFEVDLYDGVGVFAGADATPGTYDVTTADDGVRASVLLEGGRYLLDRGSITIDSVEGELTGHGDDLHLVEVDPDTGEPVSACDTTITLVQFGAPIVRTSSEGEPCDPEPCAGGTLCIGSKASNRVCRRICDDSADCVGVQQCEPVDDDGNRACLPPIQ